MKLRAPASYFRRSDIVSAAPDLIVQEWIDGAESDIYFASSIVAKMGVTVTGRNYLHP